MEEAAEKDGRVCGGPDMKEVPDDTRAGGYADTKGGIYETKGIPAGGYADTKGILKTHAGGDIEANDVTDSRGGIEQAKGVSE